MAGEVNVQGEDVKKLDVLSNELFINMMKASYSTCLLVSEENENVIEVWADSRGISRSSTQSRSSRYFLRYKYVFLRYEYVF